MRFKLTALAAYMVAVPVHAVDFEIGTGVTQYEKQPNGVWYQNGFPSDMDMTGTAISIGVSKQYGSLRYRIEYLSLGQVMSNANATTDQNYSPHYVSTCGSTCEVNKFQGWGDVWGTVFSVSRPVHAFGLPLYAEGGLWAYVPKWRVEVYSLPPNPELIASVKHDPKLEIGPMLGFGIRYSGVDVGVRYLYAEANGDQWPAIYKGAYTLMVKAYF